MPDVALPTMNNMRPFNITLIGANLIAVLSFAGFILGNDMAGLVMAGLSAGIFIGLGIGAFFTCF